jgi:hypothetical protein
MIGCVKILVSVLLFVFVLTETEGLLTFTLVATVRPSPKEATSDLYEDISFISVKETK